MTLGHLKLHRLAVMHRLEDSARLAASNLSRSRLATSRLSQSTVAKQRLEQSRSEPISQDAVPRYFAEGTLVIQIPNSSIRVYLRNCFADVPSSVV